MFDSNQLTCREIATSEWALEDVANDERLQVETFYASALGIAVSVTSSLVSTCASILVIYIIMRSVKGLKESVYHRILFGMSIFDILQSLAIAFVTLPMPKDMIYQQFQGLVLGNDFTCHLQGFVVTLGSLSGIMYNLMLSIYYLCSIRYDMTDKDFSTRLEPWLHAMSIFYGTLVAFLILWGDSMNPNPAQSNWCAANSYPYYCSGFANDDKLSIRMFTAIFGASVSFLALIVLLSCMVLIVLKVRRQEKDSRENVINSSGISRNSALRRTTSASIQTRMQEQLLNEKKTITKQAWAYTIINLFNFFMIIVMPFIRNLGKNPVPPTWGQAMVLIIRPLQGLFNCIIFIYHKVDILQRNDPSLHLWPTLKMVLSGEEGQTRIVSDLILVRHHSALAQVTFARDMDEEDYDDEDSISDPHLRKGGAVSTVPESRKKTAKEGNDKYDNHQQREEKASLFPAQVDPYNNASKHDKEKASSQRIHNQPGSNNDFIHSAPEYSVTGDLEEASQDLSGF